MIHHRIRLVSAQPSAELERRLRACTIPLPGPFDRLFGMTGRGSAAQHEFFGTVAAQHFEIQRVIRYRNSFLPLINGRFGEVTGGTSIDLVFWLHPFTGIVVLFWLAITGGVFLHALFHSGMDSQQNALILGVFFLLGLGLTVAGFIPEKRIAERRLRDLFEAKDHSPPDMRPPLVGR